MGTEIKLVSTNFTMDTRSSTNMMLGLIIVLLLFIASRPSQDTFDKITVRGFELVDKNGNVRKKIYDGLHKEEILELEKDIAVLLKEPAHKRFVNNVFSK